MGLLFLLASIGLQAHYESGYEKENKSNSLLYDTESKQAHWVIMMNLDSWTKAYLGEILKHHKRSMQRLV
jgi:hypothetical protein